MAAVASVARVAAWGGLFLAAFAATRVYLFFRPAAPSVAAFAETDPVPSSGDAADDPAIWVDPVDPERSLIVGTDKRAGIGLYALDGRQVDYQALGELNNVDLRDGAGLVPAGGPILVSGEMRRCQLVALTIDLADRKLRELPGSRVNAGVEPEGIALYRSARTGRMFVFAVGDDFDGGDPNRMEQWELVADGAGGVRFSLVRRVDIGGQSEGVVADDVGGFVYVAEEAVGVWRYSAEPDARDERVLVARAGRKGELRGDVEGLAIYRGDGAPLLLASSQGSNDFVAYRLDGAATPEYAGRFRVGAGPVDEVTHTDGIECTAASLGPRASAGLFVCQDDEDGDAHQNFKLVAMSSILATLADREP